MYHPSRRRGTAPSWIESSWPVFLALFLSLVGSTAADDPLTQSYCSSQNTAETDSTSSTWPSNGLCKTHCNGDYALAIVQGFNCWCSNLLPAEQASVSSDCNSPCKGYPYERCGDEDKGMFGYILLDKQPSGTAGASSDSASSTTSSESSQTSDAHTSSSSSSAQAQTVVNSVTVTNERTLTPSPSVIISTTTDDTPSSSPKPTSTLTSTSQSSTISHFLPPSTITDQTTTWTRTPVTSVQIVTVSNKPVTQTVTSMPTIPPDEEATQKVESKGVSGGIIAGIVIGTVAASLLIAGALFFCWRRHRRGEQPEHGTVGMIGSEGPSSRPTRNTSVLSRTGLLEKVYPSAAVAARSQANSQTNTSGPDGSGGVSPISMTERRNSRPLFYDQRLNPTTLTEFDNGSRQSVNTLPDNRDFSRTLNIRNPDPDEWD